jgi:2-dehydro-3-deoxygalactonokinase
LADFLSGLLIGHELVSGLGTIGTAAQVPLIMVGDPTLCQRYAISLRFFGKSADAVLENTAPVGLWDFACAAGLL